MRFTLQTNQITLNTQIFRTNWSHILDKGISKILPIFVLDGVFVPLWNLRTWAFTVLIFPIILIFYVPIRISQKFCPKYSTAFPTKLSNSSTFCPRKLVSNAQNLYDYIITPMTTLPCYPVLNEFHKESLIYNKYLWI